jgi:hypothetical protein
VTWSVRDVLVVTCLLAVFGAVAYATTRRARCIHCGQTTNDLHHHKCAGTRAKQTVG